MIDHPNRFILVMHPHQQSSTPSPHLHIRITNLTITKVTDATNLVIISAKYRISAPSCCYHQLLSMTAIRLATAFMGIWVALTTFVVASSPFRKHISTTTNNTTDLT